MNKIKEETKFGSDVIVSVLKELKIEYIAGNPGATIRGLQDSVVNDVENNNLLLVSCCHEEIAVAIAHGYAKAAGKPMAVLLHANIGLLHASMAIFNAWCDRVAIIIIGGVGPLATNKRRPWIDWVHTSQNHANVLEGYIKWHDQPRNLESTIESLYRGFRIADTEPKAPVYIAIDSDIQEEKLNKPVVLNKANRFMPPTLPQADNKTLENLVNNLLAAERPLIIVDHMGKNPNSVEHLVALAELLKIPVIDRGGRFNFPNCHPLCLTGIHKNEFKKIDFVFAIDVLDLAAALGEMNNGIYKSHLDSGTKIAHISLGEFLISSWVADYYKLHPVDYLIAADSSVVLPALLSKCRKQIMNKGSKNLEDRGRRWSMIHKKMRAKWWLEARQQSGENLTAPFVLTEMWEIIKNENWILTNDASVVIGQWAKKLWRFDKHENYFGASGGAGLGYGLGASIGIALANENNDKLLINLQGDGDLLFTPSALWTAANQQTPILIIIMNNGGYNNTREHGAKIAKKRKRNINNAAIGNEIKYPVVDFSMLAESFGIKALPKINAKENIQPILKEAIQYIKENRKPILVDILIE